MDLAVASPPRGGGADWLGLVLCNFSLISPIRAVFLESVEKNLSSS